MSIAKRTCAVILAFIMIAVLVLSPMLDVTNEHRKSCCGCDCLICLAANTLTLLRDIFALSPITALSLALIALACEGLHTKAPTQAHPTPIVLKTLILS